MALAHNNDPRKAKARPTSFQTIPDPTEDNLIEVVAALKEAVETIGQLRGELREQAVFFQDLVDLQVIEILDSGTLVNKLPFGDVEVSGANNGMLKFCDGETEDFGSGEGWYVKTGDATTPWKRIVTDPL